MAKKKLGNPFTGEGMGTVDTSFEAADAMLYGEIAKVDEGRQIAKPINIFDIMPDPTQPRRAIPSTVRAQWDGNPHSMGNLFNIWLDMAQEEKHSALDIAAWLEGVAEDEETSDENSHVSESSPGALEAALLQIVELAASIKRDGLTNPITIVQGDDHYLLETGERRWLAYHLLYANYRDEKWTKIPARVVEQFNVWRQATENTARADLNAIGKARQFAILMMDLWMREPDAPVQFRPLEAFPSERAFYAQVADLRVPRGKGGLLLVAIGAKNRNAFMRRRMLLSLPEQVWRIADDHNLPEDSLLKLVHMSDDDAFAEVRRMARNVTTRDMSITKVSPEEKLSLTSPLLSKQHRQNLNRVWKLADRAAHGVTDFSDKELQSLAKLRRWLDEVENMIQSRRQGKK